MRTEIEMHTNDGSLDKVVVVHPGDYSEVIDDVVGRLVMVFGDQVQQMVEKEIQRRMDEKQGASAWCSTLKEAAVHLGLKEACLRKRRSQGRFFARMPVRYRDLDAYAEAWASGGVQGAIQFLESSADETIS